MKNQQKPVKNHWKPVETNEQNRRSNHFFYLIFQTMSRCLPQRTLFKCFQMEKHVRFFLSKNQRFSFLFWSLEGKFGEQRRTFSLVLDGKFGEQRGGQGIIFATDRSIAIKWMYCLQITFEERERSRSFATLTSRRYFGMF